MDIVGRVGPFGAIGPPIGPLSYYVGPHHRMIEIERVRSRALSFAAPTISFQATQNNLAAPGRFGQKPDRRQNRK